MEGEQVDELLMLWVTMLGAVTVLPRAHLEIQLAHRFGAEFFLSRHPCFLAYYVFFKIVELYESEHRFTPVRGNNFCPE